LDSKTILNESTAVYKFVCSLKDNIARCRSDNSYPIWSNRFLEFCEHNAEATLKYIEEPKESGIEIINEAMKNNILSVRLPSIIKGWELLHSFIKPVLDANTLRVPNSFIHFLSQHIGSLNAVKDSNIVIELIPQFNYLQHRHTSVRRAMTYLKAITKSIYPDLKIGFLGLPFSQSESLFLNCLLYHEAAHFIAEEMDLFQNRKIDELKKDLGRFKPYEEWAAKVLCAWMEEIFADIVAVKLLGPAYTLAYIKLLQLTYSLSQKEVVFFKIDHPADALRIREQYEVLKTDWKDYFTEVQREELESIYNIKDVEYTPPKNYPDMQNAWKELIKILCSTEILSNIHNLANEYTKDRISSINLYKNSHMEIRECLEHGIVPSARNIPHPIAIINGAIFFLLSDMDRLYEIIIDKQRINKEKPSGRALLEQRVEMWSMKAIEDWIMTQNKQEMKNSQEVVS